MTLCLSVNRTFLPPQAKSRSFAALRMTNLWGVR